MPEEHRLRKNDGTGIGGELIQAKSGKKCGRKQTQQDNDNHQTSPVAVEAMDSSIDECNTCDTPEVS